jgi:hypothetical protein
MKRKTYRRDRGAVDDEEKRRGHVWTHVQIRRGEAAAVIRSF